MSNELGIYNPIFYAQEALQHLEKALGMAGRVHRGFEEERNTRNVGETISIRRPSTFTAQDAPSTAQDLDVETVDINLGRWKEVKFSLTDKEQAYSEDRIIADHIRPAAYALADDIDLALCDLYKDVPWYHDQAGAQAVITDLVRSRQVMFDNGVPLNDPSMMHFMLDGTAEADLLALETFHSAEKDANGGATQLRGQIGTRFGLNFFANQNVRNHVSGGMTDKVGATTSVIAAKATSIPINGIDASGEIKAGDIVEVAGITQKFVVTADVTASSGAATLSVSPRVPAGGIGSGVVVTIVQSDKSENMAFHRNAFALAMAKLPDSAQRLPGVLVQSVQDPITGLALRARVYYEGDESALRVALDVLYGVKTLDGNMAMRMRA